MLTPFVALAPKPRSQCGVTCKNMSQRRFKYRVVQPPRKIDKHSLVVVIHWHALFEEPTLDRSERRACLRRAFAGRFQGAAHRQRKFADCWALKDVSRCD